MSAHRTKPKRLDNARGRQLSRLLLLMRVLARGRWTATEAAAELGVERRTLYRMIRTLASLGLDPESTREGREVYWRLTRLQLMEWLFDE